MPNATELPINSTATAMDMADAIFGAGITVNDASYIGDPLSSGIYSKAAFITPGVTPSSSGLILSTGHVADFTNGDGSENTNNSVNTGTNTSGPINDSQFNTLAGRATRDASILETTFTPEGDLLTVDFVISSEEYPEYITSTYLDQIGIWVNGVPAQISIGNGNTSVGNLNGNSIPNLYRDNTDDQFNTEMDGFTLTLSVTAPVNPGAPNTLRIGVADLTDSGFDTNLIIGANAVQTGVVAVDDSVSVTGGNDVILDVLANDVAAGPSMTITQINGQPVSPGETVTLPSGQSVTLNADGTLGITGDNGPAETVHFNYKMTDGSGSSDTGLVQIDQVPCFCAGTRIDTPGGPVLVETLGAGDEVLTRDHGAMPILWVGSRQVRRDHDTRPVRIRAGSYGATRDVVVSPNHRVLVRDTWAELLFGQEEVLVQAKDLVNHRTVLWEDRPGPWRYFHILLDSHQMLRSDGLYSESYQPGACGFAAFDEQVRDELARDFPHLVQHPETYGAAARMSLKTREVTPLLRAMAG